MSYPQPAPFLDIRIHELSRSPSVSGLCVGYERGAWRTEGLANHVMEWLPEFSLTASECDKMGHNTAVKMLRAAAKRVYDSKKFENRGEFGEILLHAAIRQVFNSLPAISKIYYKSSINDTVKGFDAVHIVGPPDDMELWLGEVKFYEDITSAIYDVVNELNDHFETSYLKKEFALIVNKIDPKWPHTQVLERLLQPEVSLDKVFNRICVPVLLTYDSDCAADHNACSDEYVEAFKEEIFKHYRAFSAKELPKEVRIHLFLLPLLSKKKLVIELDKKLKMWQEL